MKTIAVLIGISVAALLGRNNQLKGLTENQAYTPDISSIDIPENIPEIVIDTNNVTDAFQSQDVAISFSDFFSTTVTTVSEEGKNIVADIANVFGTKYDALITASASQYGIDPNILYKLLNQESHFRDDIISGRTRSKVGALGIAQFMPATAREELGSVEAALDPSQAIPGAARYLAKLIKSTGSLKAGVAAYNWGIGNVLHKGVSRAPSETVAYVSSITGDI